MPILSLLGKNGTYRSSSARGVGLNILPRYDYCKLAFTIFLLLDAVVHDIDIAALDPEFLVQLVHKGLLVNSCANGNEVDCVLNAFLHKDFLNISVHSENSNHLSGKIFDNA